MARTRIQFLSSVLTVLLAGTGLTACKGGGGGGDGDTESGTDSDTSGNDDGAAMEPFAGGIRRMLGHQYVRTIRTLLGPEAAAVADPPADFSLHDFDSIAAAELSLQTTNIEEYELSATAIADAAVANKQTLAQTAGCVLQGSDDSTCYQSVAADFGRVAWRRTLTEEEVATSVAIAEQARAWGEGEFDVGLKYQLIGLLQSPSFLYMVEVGEPDEASGHRLLTGTEMATRMSFFLLGRTPDAGMLDLAEAGDLATSDQVRSVAVGMLSLPDAREALAAFYDEAFHLREVPGLQKSDEMFPMFSEELGEMMRQEVLMLIDDVVWERELDALTLFDADYTFVTAETALLYGVPAPGGAGFEMAILPEAQNRSGYLTSLAFAARNAHPASTSPTRRGLFLQHKILCNEIPPPPMGVLPEVPDFDPNDPKTLRERLEIHMEDDSCRGCHGLTDTIGFTVENFDPIGQYRTLDNGLPIDSAATIPELGDVANGAGLGAALRVSPKAHECIVKNFIRGGLGHIETPGEAPALEDLYVGFEESAFNMQDLLVELVASPVFRFVDEPK